MTSATGWPETLEVQSPQLDLRFGHDCTNRTRILRRRSRYPYVVLRPFWFGDLPEGMATLILQSGSGGMYGGEVLGQRFVVDANAAAHVTTQAAAVVHDSRNLGPTVQQVRMEIGDAAHFEYVADPLILFPGAALHQEAEARIGHGATLIYADGVVRHDPGPEDRSFRQYASRLSVRGPDGALLLRDDTVVDGRGFDFSLARDRHGWSATGLVLAVSPARTADHGDWCAELNLRLGSLGAVAKKEAYASCGLLPNNAGVACRVVARDGHSLRATIELSWRTLRHVVTGSAAPRSRK